MLFRIDLGKSRVATKFGGSKSPGWVEKIGIGWSFDFNDSVRWKLSWNCFRDFFTEFLEEHNNKYHIR